MFIPQNAEPAVNSDTALPTSTSAGSSLTGNFRTNLIEATDNSRPALDPHATDSDTTRCIQSQPPRSANSSDDQLDSTAEHPAVPLLSASHPPCMSDYIVESLETSLPATEQGVARATALMHRVMEKRAEREQQLNL